MMKTMMMMTIIAIIATIADNWAAAINNPPSSICPKSLSIVMRQWWWWWWWWWCVNACVSQKPRCSLASDNVCNQATLIRTVVVAAGSMHCDVSGRKIIKAGIAWTQRCGHNVTIETAKVQRLSQYQWYSLGIEESGAECMKGSGFHRRENCFTFDIWHCFTFDSHHFHDECTFLPWWELMLKLV